MVFETAQAACAFPRYHASFVSWGNSHFVMLPNSVPDNFSSTDTENPSISISSPV